MKELNKKIQAWGQERLIDKNSAIDQLPKLQEEYEELLEAIKDNNLVEIKDAIGDMYVVLQMLGMQTNNIIKVAENGKIQSYDEETLLTTIRRSIEDMPRLLDGGNEVMVNTVLNLVASCIDGIAQKYNLTLLQCVEYAYNEIKDRKGMIKNGCFVKYANLTLQEQVVLNASGRVVM